jgi:xanthine dehydrogenase molybdopterin-binding subunit B
MGPPDVAARVRGSGPITTRDYPMPPDQARFVGEPVALVVAETIDQAKDVAEQLQIGYEPLPAVASRRKTGSWQFDVRQSSWGESPAARPSLLTVSSGRVGNPPD